MLVLMVKQFTLDHTSLVLRGLLVLEHLVTLLLSLMTSTSWKLVDGECDASHWKDMHCLYVAKNIVNTPFSQGS